MITYAILLQQLITKEILNLNLNHLLVQFTTIWCMGVNGNAE